MAYREESLTFTGTFERTGRGASPLEGAGTLSIVAAGLRVEAAALRSTLATVLSGVAGAVAMVGAVVLAFAYEGELDAITDGDSLRAAVAAGLAAAMGGYFLTRALMVRVLPLRRIDRVVPFAYLVSPVVERSRILIGCSAPELAGRMAFHTERPSELLSAIERARAR